MGWSKGYYYSHGCYVGKGENATLTAELDRLDRNQARQERNRARRLERAERQAFQQARQAAAAAARIIAQGLQAAGFWRRARHAWQRKRIMSKTNAPAIAAAMTDLAELAEATFIDRIGRTRELRVSIAAKTMALRAELLSGFEPAPAALRLAVEGAVYAWLDQWTVEIIAASKLENITPALDRRRNWAHRRYGQSLVVVERIRRLCRASGPTVAIQINHNSPPAIRTENRILELAS
jgi:hypothetical protein